MTVASLDWRGGTTVELSALFDHDGGEGAAEVFKDEFCCFWTFLNLSCSSAAFCEHARETSHVDLSDDGPTNKRHKRYLLTLAAAASGPRDITQNVDAWTGDGMGVCEGGG